MELPFTLTHPKPEMPTELIPVRESGTGDKSKKNGADQTVPIDLNLIEFDTQLVSFCFVFKIKSN